MNLSRIIGMCITSIAIIAVSCIDRPNVVKQARRPVSVDTTMVLRRNISFPIHASGKLSSRSEIKLSFKTGGIIAGIYVNEGENIARGTKMAQLNLSEIQATANQATLGMKKAGRDLTRVQNLYRDSVATLELLENARTAYEVAVNQSRIANFNLKYSTISAPSNGKVLKRIAEENEMIGPGYPVFLFAATENDWVLKVNLTDKEIVNVELMDSAHVRFDAYTDRYFGAWVSEIGSVADPYTGTYEVEITLELTDINLVSGFIGKADIFPATLHSVLLVHVDALVEASEQTGYVFVIENGKPVRKKIDLGGFWQNMIIVEKGLEPGMILITEGAGFIGPDSQISIRERSQQ